MACPALSFEIGGSTPNASQVKKNMFFGAFPTEGITALSIKWIG
jgi:hypothetical protein